MRRLETATFWHAPPDGAPVLASSVVGPAPLDVTAAHALALRTTSYPPATGINRAYLDYPTLGPDSLDGVKRVMAAYQSCARCHLSSSRMRVVHCRGNPAAVLAFLGEGPGKDENDIGEPFVGRSGKLQDEITRAASIDPVTQVFWMNVLGCRAGARWGDDRPPTFPELAACSERTYLMLQAVRPRIVVCLGKVATRYFFDEPPPVWSFTRFAPPDAPQDWVMVGYAHHPAYLVRVIAAPSMYKEYAAQRTFYSTLAQRMVGLTKVERWHFPPRYLSALQGPVVAWPGGTSEPDGDTEDASA
jgi:DNA polymerase